MFEHQLSEETIRLIVQAVDVLGGRLAIYATHNWAIETIEGGRLAFDPVDDTQHLRDELAFVIAHGHFR